MSGCPYTEGRLGDKEREAHINGENYQNYLQLEKLLALQNPSSAIAGNPQHDELLFIIVHQAYELWFKQILHELSSVMDFFRQGVPENTLLIILERLNRITDIQKLLIQQMRIVETMTAMEFLSFRNYLNPGSGFQSLQFRLFENKLGLHPDNRINYNSTDYTQYFKTQNQTVLEASHTETTLAKLVERWLESFPFVDDNDGEFWKLYRKAVEDMLQHDKFVIESNPHNNEEIKDTQTRGYQKTCSVFDELFNESRYNELREAGIKRFSYRAMKAVIFIYSYRDYPLLQAPFRLLTLLTDVDENTMIWRFHHLNMVQRMIGVKNGTGGSTGYHYLRATLSDNYKAFLDLFQVSTFLLPQVSLPTLPESISSKLGFTFNTTIRH